MPHPGGTARRDRNGHAEVPHQAAWSAVPDQEVGEPAASNDAATAALVDDAPAGAPSPSRARRGAGVAVVLVLVVGGGTAALRRGDHATSRQRTSPAPSTSVPVDPHTVVDVAAAEDAT